MHLDRLDFSGNVAGSKVDDHSSLDDTSLDTTDGHRANTTNLVDVLERETEGLVRWARGGVDGVDGIKEGLALDNTGLVLLGPTLVPRHAEKKVSLVLAKKNTFDTTYLGDSSNMLSPCQPEMGTNATVLGL